MQNTIRQPWVRSEEEYARLERLLTHHGSTPFITIEQMMAEEPGCPYCGAILREVEGESGAGLRDELHCEKHGEIKSC